MVFVVGSPGWDSSAPNWATLTYGETVSFTDRTLRLQGLSAHPNALGGMAFRLAARLLADRCTLPTCRLRRGAVRAGADWLPHAALRLARMPSHHLVLSPLRAETGVDFAAPARRPDDAHRCSSGGNRVLDHDRGLRDTGYTQGLSSGSGRTDVWDLTLREWHSSPLVGYGPSLWSPGYRSSHGFSALSWVGQAHNQFVEALGQTGLIGFIALVLFVSAAFAVGWKGRRIDHGLTLTLTSQ